MQMRLTHWQSHIRLLLPYYCFFFSTQLNEFEGYSEFLARREKVKSKDIYGGALTNLDVCGLK